MPLTASDVKSLFFFPLINRRGGSSAGRGSTIIYGGATVEGEYSSWEVMPYTIPDTYQARYNLWGVLDSVTSKFLFEVQSSPNSWAAIDLETGEVSLAAQGIEILRYDNYGVSNSIMGKYMCLVDNYSEYNEELQIYVPHYILKVIKGGTQVFQLELPSSSSSYPYMSPDGKWIIFGSGSHPENWIVLKGVGADVSSTSYEGNYLDWVKIDDIDIVPDWEIIPTSILVFTGDYLFYMDGAIVRVNLVTLSSDVLPDAEALTECCDWYKSAFSKYVRPPGVNDLYKDGVLIKTFQVPEGFDSIYSLRVSASGKYIAMIAQINNEEPPATYHLFVYRGVS